MYKDEKIKKVEFRLSEICEKIKKAEEDKETSAEELQQLYNKKNELVGLLNYIQ